jgi:tetratricopeptide (TPR) repeat protein
MLAKAVSLHQPGQLTEAVFLSRKILARDPKNADILHFLGVIELQTKRPSKAIELIDRAIKLSPPMQLAGFGDRLVKVFAGFDDLYAKDL